MKFTTTTALTLASVVAASPLPGPEPFKLELSTPNKDLNGKQIGGCHAGAAIEAACIVDADKGNTFYLDTDQGAQAPVPNYSVPSNIVYQFPIGENGTELLTLNLVGDYASNVQEALFEPTDSGAQISFDSKQVGGIFSYLDDTVTPPKGGEAKFYNNFYVCETYYASYTYQTLAWVSGSESAKPQNPSCAKVDLIRKTIA